jgi:hypothetical protein
MRHEVKADGRGRVSLGGVRRQRHEWYLATEEADGTIILVPSVLVPAEKTATSRERPPAGGVRGWEQDALW